MELEWDCLDGGCQAAQTPLGRITAWEDGTLVVPGRENRRYESLLAAKIAARKELEMIDGDRKRMQVEFARRLAEMLGIELAKPITPILDQEDGPEVVTSAAHEVVRSLAQHQQRGELLRRPCVACGLGQVTFARAESNGHARWNCDCGLVSGME